MIQSGITTVPGGSFVTVGPFAIGPTDVPDVLAFVSETSLAFSMCWGDAAVTPTATFSWCFLGDGAADTVTIQFGNTSGVAVDARWKLLVY